METSAESNRHSGSRLLGRTQISLTCSHGTRVLISFYKSVCAGQKSVDTDGSGVDVMRDHYTERSLFILKLNLTQSDCGG